MCDKFIIMELLCCEKHYYDSTTFFKYTSLYTLNYSYLLERPRREFYFRSLQPTETLLTLSKPTNLIRENHAKMI